MSTHDFTELSLQQLASLYKLFKQFESPVFAKKALDLVEKKQEGELVVGFAGHFSAGKSTMINSLLGEEILPSSPIPTSANLVKVRKGSGVARVFFNEENPIEYKEPYDLEAIKAFCKDGDAIRELELAKAETNLPDHITIMDTPGIDSSNDADRIMTESALHIVDLLVYVMDYNHVQSEVNLAFLLEMQRKNMPIYIIINQIDKHNPEELTFDSFQQSVYESLKNWGIEVEQVFFTSLTQSDHPHNQFNEMKQTMHTLFAQRQSLVQHTLYQSTNELITEYIHQEQESQQPKIEELTAKIASFSTYDQETLEDELEKVNQLREEAEATVRKRIDHSIKNATLMPYDIREKAKDFIESQQPQFKVGFLFTKNKTEEEREKRLNDFHQALLEQSKANLEWPVRKALVEIAKQFNINDEETLQKLQNYEASFDKDLLHSLINQGAGTTGDYVLNYSEDVAQEIKKHFKQEALLVWENATIEIQKAQDTQKRELEHQQEQIENVEALEQELTLIEEMQQQQKMKLYGILHGDEVDQYALDEATEVLITKEQHVRTDQELVLDASEPSQTEDHTSETEGASEDTPFTIHEMLEKIDETKHALEDLSGFSSLQQDLLDKKKRLQSRHYTVALFGAFSAGKSSFANALLGDSVLPVSPNPTTATINKISPPTNDNHHGDVMVKVKDTEDILEDLSLATDRYSEQFDTLQSFVDWLKEDETRIENITPDQKRWSFLKAVVTGYPFIHTHLGTTMRVNMDEFRDYVSQEERSCFIEWMELYYDCPFTQQGITLVDTPGADSVNARHTETSFEYIKDADAILFVTYYNHAFSGADRDFLLQLGRVKDAFSLDKMFFIVNAADLAKTKGELQLVTQYVEEQLVEYGIRAPRLFPVSSKFALPEKLGEFIEFDVLDHSGLPNFEQVFQQFIDQELVQLLVHAALYDMERASYTIEQYIQSASLDQTKKGEKKQQFQSDKDQIVDLINQSDQTRYISEIENKLSKQMYYVQQRLFLQFSDFFKQTFNPATIKGSGKEAKAALFNSFEQLIEQLQHELLQEFRAVSVRLETFTNQVANEWKEDLEEKCKREGTPVSLPYLQSFKVETPTFSIQVGVSSKDKEFSQTLYTFKNTKSFFELNEKETMKQKLEESLKPYIEQIIQENTSTLTSYYTSEWQYVVDAYMQQAEGSVKEYYDGLILALGESLSIEQLQSTKSRIQQLIQH